MNADGVVAAAALPAPVWRLVQPSLALLCGGIGGLEQVLVAAACASLGLGPPFPPLPLPLLSLQLFPPPCVLQHVVHGVPVVHDAVPLPSLLVVQLALAPH